MKDVHISFTYLFRQACMSGTFGDLSCLGSGSVALRQLKPIHKKGPLSFIYTHKYIYTHGKCYCIFLRKCLESPVMKI